MQRSALCRSRRELSNAYLLAKFDFDTAENEPCKVCRIPWRRAHDGSSRRGGRRASARRGSRAARRWPSCTTSGPFFKNAFSKNAFSKNAFSKNAFFENFAKFCRARSRLYQNEFLQVNTRSTAFFKLYKICILLHRCNLNFFRKISV